MKYKTIILFSLACITCLPVIAQDELWSRDWHAARAKDSVRQVVILERSGKRFDTLHIYQYDSLGRKVRAKRFGNKNSGNHSIMTLKFKDTLCISWTARYDYGDIETGRYKYDARGNLLKSQYYRMKSGDTSIQQTSIYSFNSKQQLLKEKTTESGLPYFEVLYVYSKGKLVRKLMDPYNGADPDREELYYYNASGLLDSSRINSIKGPLKKEQEFRSFRYENGRIVETLHRNYKGIATLTRYTYNTDGLPDSSNAVEGTSYTITKYTYAGGKLVSEKITTNMLTAPLAENQTYKRRSPYQFTFEIQYLYDQKGNLVEKTKTLDGEIIEQRRFIIEYD